MRANEAATTHDTPAARMATGACSRELPQPKFSPATMMSPGCTRGHEVAVDVFHAVRAQLGRVARVQVAGRDDDVGVDVASVGVRGAFEDHDLPPASEPLRAPLAPIMSGVAMWPAIAEAAAT